METFKGADVAPINEILERTHYVQALRAEIERLTNAGLEAAYGEATKADELEHWIATCDRLTAERDDLAAKLEWRDAQFSAAIRDRDHESSRSIDLAGKLAAAHQELHDLRIRAGLGEFDPDESIMIACPRCGAEQEDMDGFGVLHCEVCKYCVHPSADDGVCNICGQEV